MTDLRSAAQQALWACKLIVSAFDALKPASAARNEPLQINAARASITALEAALAEPQEPVQQALCEADRIMGHDDESTEWRERWAHLFSCALTNGGYQCSCGANQRNAK